MWHERSPECYRGSTRQLALANPGLTTNKQRARSRQRRIDGQERVFVDDVTGLVYIPNRRRPEV